jgi:hypothetical protein
MHVTPKRVLREAASDQFETRFGTKYWRPVAGRERFLLGPTSVLLHTDEGMDV